MPLQKPNKFTEYALTPQEVIIGSTYNELQLCVLHNELANAANTKLNMKYKGADIEILQEEAELQGRINALDWLIQNHENAQQEYLRLQIAAAQTQQDE